MRRAADSLTLDMFAIPAPATPSVGGLDVGMALRHLLSDLLKTSPLTRYQVAAKMSELTGHDISKHQLDSWTAESREGWRFPIEYGAESGLSALEDLILYADPRYRHARTVADLAHAAEKRWQTGTRLDFVFCDTIDAEMERLFDVIDSPISNECKKLADKIARHVWAQHIGKTKP